MRCGPLSAPAGPAAHSLGIIRHLAEIAGGSNVGSINHCGTAYATLANSNAIGRLRPLAHDGETDDIRDVQANADRIRGSILSGKPMDEGQEFATPSGLVECLSSGN